MTDAGFFKGTSAEQDARFADKKKKLMKTMKFGENLAQKVDMTRINLESIRPWIVKRITELLNFEDEVVCDYVFNQLEERVFWDVHRKQRWNSGLLRRTECAAGTLLSLSEELFI
ncbi:unnamed protein product [Heterobilharzia americana]|nr:unnamed protein product [Heterobilharzia americana]